MRGGRTLCCCPGCRGCGGWGPTALRVKGFLRKEHQSRAWALGLQGSLQSQQPRCVRLCTEVCDQTLGNAGGERRQTQPILHKSESAPVLSDAAWPSLVQSFSQASVTHRARALLADDSSRTLKPTNPQAARSAVPTAVATPQPLFLGTEAGGVVPSKLFSLRPAANPS